MTYNVVVLQQMCEAWQKVLRLRDWDVEVKIARRSEMPGGHTADVKYNASSRRATVRLLDPADYVSEDGAGQDHEISLVHELMHLQFVALDPLIEHNPLADLVLEQALKTLSSAVVEMLRSTTAATNDRQVVQDVLPAPSNDETDMV